MAQHTVITDEENELLNNLRDEFLAKYNSNIEKKEYDERDLVRLKENNVWLYAFYRHTHQKRDVALTLIDDVLKWRASVKANDFLSGNLPFSESLFEKGSMFLRNTDKKGSPLLHFAVRTHKKDQNPHEQVCKFIAYHFEKSYKFNWDNKIIVFFDMSSTGLGNLDMEMIKFVITCLKTYYPGLIDYMLIFQMPFIFNAAWKIIKNWLPPEAQQLIKFVDKKSILEYVSQDQIFTHMGGTDTFQYKYDPSALKQAVSDELIRKRVSFASIDSIQLSGSTVRPIMKSKSEVIPKQQQQKSGDVTQANGSNATFTLFDSNNNNTTTITSPNELYNSVRVDDSVLDNQNKAVESATNQNTQQKHDSDKDEDQKMSVDKTANLELLSISPSDEVVFQINDTKTDVFQFIKLQNSNQFLIAFKIKITSPDKFRVKPGSGTITPESCVQITINFLKDYHNNMTQGRDKFLILWTKVEDNAKTNDISEFWKQATHNKQQIYEHKLRCIISRQNSDNTQMNNQNQNDSNYQDNSISITSVNQTYAHSQNLHSSLKNSNNNAQYGSVNDSTIGAFKNEIKELKNNVSIHR